MTSEVYALSSLPTQYNAKDRRNYARYFPKRMAAEVLSDAVDTLCGSRKNFGLPRGDAGDRTARRGGEQLFPRRLRPFAARIALRVRTELRAEPGPDAASAQLARIAARSCKIPRAGPPA